MKRVALYARFSSDLQNPRSCDDQLAMLREEAARRGWKVVAEYRDEAISGASIFTRPGILALLRDAEARRFDIAFSEALDRITRDDADAPMIRKRLAFHGVTLWTVSEGEVQILHTALKGAMNAMFLEELARKVKRGHRRVQSEGRATGMLAYGYKATPGQRGVWEINEAEAAIVRRIFDEYAPAKGPGFSALEIAKRLNDDGVPAPNGRLWQRNTIGGNGQPGCGILLNPIYVGMRIYNRQRTVKNPETGKRSMVINPEKEWVRTEVPQLRIVSDDVFERAGRMAQRMSGKRGRARRPKKLFSGLLRCGSCGGQMVVISTSTYRGVATSFYGCAANRYSGACANHRVISEREIFERAVGGLRAALANPAAARNAMKAFREEMARLQKDAGSRRQQLERDAAEAARRIARLVTAIEEGASTPETIDRLKALRTQRETAEAELGLIDSKRSVVALHPAGGDVYASMVDRLAELVAKPDPDADELRTNLRSFITHIVLTPGPRRGDYAIELHGDLAGVLDNFRHFANVTSECSHGSFAAVVPFVCVA